ncbi:hypothetical protein MP638_000971 [Amoeboaphelidium occidentale]|nr:hypothetical protein MP638_000971 [Amoeboaphelidium occidentale]
MINLQVKEYKTKPRNVPYQRPVELACFSLDHNRQFHFDDRELKYYYPVDLQNPDACNLNAGYPEKFIKRDDSVPEYLINLQKALMNITEWPKEDLCVDFVSWRGIFTKICLTPYDSNDSWEFILCKRNGSIYISEVKKEQKSYDERQDRFVYYGYKFETISTVPVHPSAVGPKHLQERLEQTVNNHSEYGSVLKTKIGRNSVIIGAEVDCTLDNKVPNDPGRFYAELKTSKIILSQKDERSFEKYKLLKFYFQSFLAAVPKIIVGFRDDDGYVRSTQQFDTLKIPRLVREKGYWDPNVGLTFCNDLLDLLKENVKEEMVAYRLSFDAPFTEVILQRAEDVSIDNILPEWFKNKF